MNEFIIPQILTPDLYLLAGKPRSGKTTIAKQLAQAIASGGKFFDRPTTQGSVIYISLNEPPIHIGREMDPNLPIVIISHFTHDIDGLQALEEQIVRHSPVRLIVIDDLKAVIPVTGDSFVMQFALETYKVLCKQHQVCILLVTDLNKNGNIKGSTCIPAMAEGIWTLREDDRGKILEMANHHGTIKRRLADLPV